MLSDVQLSRLAGLGNSLRPDWANASLVTFLAKNVRDRAYRDVAVALAYVACDPVTKTPARLLEAGPWWSATRDPNAAPTVRPITCRDCGQVHTKAEGCKRNHEPASPEDIRRRKDEARAALAASRAGLCHAHKAPTCRDCDHPEPKENHR